MHSDEDKLKRVAIGSILIVTSICFFLCILYSNSNIKLQKGKDYLSSLKTNLDGVSKIARNVRQAGSFTKDSDTTINESAETSLKSKNNSESFAGQNNVENDIICWLQWMLGYLPLHVIYITLFLWGISFFARPRGLGWTVRFIGSGILIIGLMMIEVSISSFTKESFTNRASVSVDFWKGNFSSPSGEYLISLSGIFIAIAGFFMAFDWLAVVFLYKVIAIVKYILKGIFACISRIIMAIVWVINFMLSEEKDKAKVTLEKPVEQQMEIDFNLPSQGDENSISSSSRFRESSQSEGTEFSPLPSIPEIGNSEDKYIDGMDVEPVRSDCNLPILEGGSICSSQDLEIIDLHNDKDTVNKVSNTQDLQKYSNTSNSELIPLQSSHGNNNNVNNSEVPIMNSEGKKYVRPPIDIFEVPPPSSKKGYSVNDLEKMAQHLEETLERFGAKAKVDTITQGPSVTRFELIPDPSVRVNRFQALADDITLALKVDRVRVEAPIPGKGKVGVEVPNKERETVWIRELLEDSELKRTTGKLKVPLGKDVTGKVRVVDIAPMPHLLIAGATGSGKTVFMKQLLVSLLYQYTPEDLRVILIDPKLVEFSVFDGIPHLLMPVISDVKKAVECLSLLVKEMERRYEFLAQKGMNNIETYNKYVENGEMDLFRSLDNNIFKDSEDSTYQGKLPYIVCIIDELADLILLQKNLVETLIIRLSQLARAVGIHLIVATQRPSVDVLRGLIKANFPVRISFRVSSKADSQCILDSIGGEKLIGNGDMLYYNGQKPVRIQGAYVSEKEVFSLVDFLKKQGPPQYINTNNFCIIVGPLREEYGDDDPLYEKAVRTVLREKQASVSLLQRKLRIGYARAGNLIDLMERRGVVGPHCGSKPREILLSPEEIQRILGTNIDFGDYNDEERDEPPQALVL